MVVICLLLAQMLSGPYWEKKDGLHSIEEYGQVFSWLDFTHIIYEMNSTGTFCLETRNVLLAFYALPGILQVLARDLGAHWPSLEKTMKEKVVSPTPLFRSSLPISPCNFKLTWTISKLVICTNIAFVEDTFNTACNSVMNFWVPHYVILVQASCSYFK